MSAVRSTKHGDLPPSSSVTGVRCSAGRAHDDFADVAATGIEDVVERAFQQFAGFLGPAFDHAHGLGVKVLRHQLSKELGRIR